MRPWTTLGTTLGTTLAAGTAIAALAAPAAAQSPAEFYKGKNLTVVVSAGTGGGYDTYARAFTRFFERHVPGKPSVIVQNMPGAGGLRATNHLFTTAAKDGTVIGTVHSAMTMAPLFGQKKAQFKPREFGWVGNISSESTICVAWHTASVKTAQDLLEKPFIVGSTGAGANMSRFPKVLNAAVGTKIKVIEGYKGGSDVVLAMERGEVEGRCGWTYSGLLSTHGENYKAGRIRILLQAAIEKDPNMPDVPIITDFVKSKLDRDALKLIFATAVIARPVLAPPGVPADRLAALREAFDATMKDPEFLAYAEKNRLEIRSMSGKAAESLVREFYDSPTEVVARATAILGAAQGPKKGKKK
jgi:tripartite-type tricarboxylate transporter receptor subunit TctC